MNCRAYAKALHYKEEDFHRGVTPKLLESLIAINNKLQQPDAAVGVLMFAKERQQGDFVSISVSTCTQLYIYMYVGILIFEAFKAFLRMLKACGINFVGSCLMVCVLQLQCTCTYVQNNLYACSYMHMYVSIIMVNLILIFIVENSRGMV